MEGKGLRAALCHIDNDRIRAECTHLSGKRCVLYPHLSAVDEYVWVSFDPDEDEWYRCELNHATVKIPSEIKVSSDRGEFGMPGLGSTAAGFDVTHAPEWKIGVGMIMPEPASDLTIKVDDDKVTVDYGKEGWTKDVVTDEARRIMGAWLPDWIFEFLDKNKKYASVQSGHDLGPEGEVPDLNRKMGILVDRLWLGNPTIGEETKEVVRDMIGHLFLLLDKLEDEDDA